MIDEKKIRNAARDFCKSLEKERKAIQQAELNKGANFACVYIRPEVAFKAGINWFLDNLWHDASEEPKENSTVVLVAKFDNEPYTAFYSHSFEAFNGEGVFLIKDADHNDDGYFFPKDIDKWCYFDDLLKGGK